MKKRWSESIAGRPIKGRIMSLAKPPIVAAQRARFIAIASAPSLAAALGSAPAVSSEMPSASARRCPSACWSGSVTATSALGFSSNAKVSCAAAPELKPESACSVLLVGVPCGARLIPVP